MTMTKTNTQQRDLRSVAAATRESASRIRVSADNILDSVMRFRAAEKVKQ